MSESTTVILGAGFGGAATALALRAHLPPAHRIVLVDRDEHFVIGAGNLWIATGRARAEETRSSRRVLAERGVEFLQTEVEALDAEARVVSTAGGKLSADFLVVALGAELNPGAVPGLEAAHTFYTAAGAERLYAELEAFKGGEVVVLVPRAPFKCPPAPYEGAIAIAEKLAGRARVSVFTLEPAPMPSAGAVMGNFLREQLKRAGVSFHPLKKTTGVDAAARKIHFEDGDCAAFDLLVAVPPHQAPRVVREAKLAPEGGWIAVDPGTLRTPFERVWAIGDVTAVPLPGRFKPEAPLVIPKAGSIAEREATVVARQIAALALKSGESSTAFDGRGECYIELGGGTAVRGLGQFFGTPHPVVQPSAEPSADELRTKQEWIRRRLAFDFS